MLTKKEWDKVNLNFDHYVASFGGVLPVEVDEALYFYFAEVVPPVVDVACKGYLMGEAVDSNSNWDFTYMAFVERNKKYYYVGDLTEEEFEEELKKPFFFLGRLSPSGGWIVEWFHGSESASSLHKCLSNEEGWYQHPTIQDNWYFFHSRNHNKLQMATYTEGDVAVIYHVNKNRYEHECIRADNFYRHC